MKRKQISSLDHYDATLTVITKNCSSSYTVWIWISIFPGISSVFSLFSIL